MLHVFPLLDGIEHKLEGTGCVCKPRVELKNGEMIVIHNSADGREQTEDKNRRKVVTF